MPRRVARPRPKRSPLVHREPRARSASRVRAPDDGLPAAVRAVESRAGVRTPRECFRPNALNHLWHTAVLAVVQHGTHFHVLNYYVTSATRYIVTVCPCGERSTSPIIGSANAQCGSLIGPGIGVTPPLVSGGTVRNASFLAGVAARRAPVRGRAEASSRFPHRTSVAEGLRSVRGGSGRRLSSVKLSRRRLSSETGSPDITSDGRRLGEARVAT